MENLYKDMVKWEIEKALYLQSIAVDLGMNLTGYGEVAVNPNSWNTYLWLEDYNFTLYMPISCELIRQDVVALWTNPNSGEELEYTLSNKTTLKTLEDWANKLSNRYAIN